MQPWLHAKFFILASFIAHHYAPAKERDTLYFERVKKALETTPTLWPSLVYFIVVMLTVAGMLGVSYVLGQRHSEIDTGIPYESGITPTGSARLRFPVNFYLVAMLFIVFDVESVFIISWAIGMKALGWPGFVEIAIFIGILGVALFYLCQVGALDFGPKATRKKIT